jgi:hypothetical protein
MQGSGGKSVRWMCKQFRMGNLPGLETVDVGCIHASTHERIYERMRERMHAMQRGEKGGGAWGAVRGDQRMRMHAGTIAG